MLHGRVELRPVLEREVAAFDPNFDRSGQGVGVGPRILTPRVRRLGAHDAGSLSPGAGAVLGGGEAAV